MSIIVSIFLLSFLWATNIFTFTPVDFSYKDNVDSSFDSPPFVSRIEDFVEIFFGAYVIKGENNVAMQADYDLLKKKITALLKSAHDPLPFITAFDEAMVQIRSLEQLSGESLVSSESVQGQRSAILVIGIGSLLNSIHISLIRAIALLDQHELYWEAQIEYPSYYYMIQQPLLWLTGNHKKGISFRNRKYVADLRQRYQKALGVITIAASSFDPSADSQKHDLWVRQIVEACEVFFVKPVVREAEVADDSANGIKRIAQQLAYHEKHLLYLLKPVAIPSHLQRNCIWYGFGTASLLAFFIYRQKICSESDRLMSRGCALAQDNYTKYLKGPLRSVSEALGFSSEPQRQHDEKRALLIQVLENGVKQILENIEKVNNNIGDRSGNIRVVKEDVQNLFIRTAIDFRNFHNEHFKSVVAWRPSDKEIAHAAEHLSKPFLHTMFDVFSQDCGKAGYLQIRSMLNWAVPLANVSGQVIAYRGGNIAEAVAQITQAFSLMVKAVVPLIEPATIHSDTIITQTRLTIALFALLPVMGLMWLSWRGVKKGSKYIIPQKYDDTPIKKVIVELRDELDDALYVNAEDGNREQGPQAIGRIVYHTTLLRKEFYKVSREVRGKMMRLLNKFFKAPTNQGKRVYLEKMLREYDSWPR